MQIHFALCHAVVCLTPALLVGCGGSGHSVTVTIESITRDKADAVSLDGTKNTGILANPADEIGARWGIGLHAVSLAAVAEGVFEFDVRPAGGPAQRIEVRVGAASVDVFAEGRSSGVRVGVE